MSPRGAGGQVQLAAHGLVLSWRVRPGACLVKSCVPGIGGTLHLLRTVGQHVRAHPEARQSLRQRAHAALCGRRCGLYANFSSRVCSGTSPQGVPASGAQLRGVRCRRWHLCNGGLISALSLGIGRGGAASSGCMPYVAGLACRRIRAVNQWEGGGLPADSPLHSALSLVLGQLSLLGAWGIRPTLSTLVSALRPQRAGA